MTLPKVNSNSNGKQEANNKKFKVFCGSCDLEITSRKNGISNNIDFCVMTLKAWLDSWLSKSRIFHIKKNDFDNKNLLIRLNGFPLLFLDLYWAKKKLLKSIKRKYCEIVAVGIINYPLIIPYRLTKTCSDSTKEPRVQ